MERERLSIEITKEFKKKYSDFLKDVAKSHGIKSHPMIQNIISEAIDNYKTDDIDSVLKYIK